jgi:hypothetical protein
VTEKGSIERAQSLGWALAQYAAAHQPTLPVIVVTGWAYVMDTDEHYGRVPVFLNPSTLMKSSPTWTPFSRADPRHAPVLTRERHPSASRGASRC